MALRTFLLRAAVLLVVARCPALVLSRTLAEVTELHIAHVNDVHNRIEETSPIGGNTCSPSQREGGVCLGGWGRITSAVRAARKEAAKANAGFLFLDAGDEFDGTLWDVVYHGAANAAMQNIAKQDVMTLGNHEFSFEHSVLRDYIKNLTFPMLGACNVDVSGIPALKGLVKKYEVFTFGGKKVAVVGWLTPDTAFTAANAVGVKFGRVGPSVKQCIADLKKEHPDVHMIIGLSHTGYEADLRTAKAVPDLDIIIGGHTHTFLYNKPGGPIFDKTTGATPANCEKERVCDEPSGPYATFVDAEVCTPGKAKGECVAKKIPVVQAYWASKYLGHLKIDLATKALISGRPILLGGANSSSPWPQDPEVLRAIEKMSGPVRALQNKTAGRIADMLVGGKVGRQIETNFGSYIASLLVQRARSLPKFEAENGPVNIGLINAGGIRNDIDAGSVTYGEVLTALPFKNSLAVKAVTGKELDEALAHGLSGFDDKEGRFLQVSGLRIWHRGPRLVSAKLLLDNGTTLPIDGSAKYNIAMIDYIANGGDGFTAFEKAKSLLALGDDVDDLVFKDLQKAMPKDAPIPDPANNPRIINCDVKESIDCSNKELFGPCCPGAAPDALAEAAAETEAQLQKNAAKDP